MSNLVLPRVQAMVLCDDAVESGRESGVFYLIGVRTVVVAPSFPIMHSLCVFAQLTGHEGDATLHVHIESAESSELGGESEPQTVSFLHPTISVPVLFRFPHCVLSTSGLYYVEMYHDEKLIGERRLHAELEE